MAVRFVSRLAVFAVSLLASTVLVFLLMAILPGDPARVALGINASPEAVERLRTAYGLDRPLLVQYLDWLRQLVTADLGRSYISGAPMAPQIADRFQVTLILVLVSMVVAVAIALPLGFLAAVRHRHVSGVVL